MITGTSRPQWLQLVCLFLASRGALFLVGLFSTYLLPSGLTVQRGNLVAHAPAPRALEMWARWDSEWYLLIAREGYQVGDLVSGAGVPYEPWAAAGFLPLYPVLIRLLGGICGPVAAGVLISNVCLLVSLLLLDRLLRLELGEPVGRRAGVAAGAAMLLFPSSLFLSAVYAESLFLMLSLMVFVGAVSGRFWAAGIAGALAAVTRPFGLLLMIPIVFEWWRQRRAARSGGGGGGPSVPSLAWSAAVPAGLGVYLMYCWDVFGDPLVLVRRQERWRGGLSGPWRAFQSWWEAGPVAHGSHGSTYELVIAVACLVLLLLMARRLRPVYTVYATACVALALGSTLWSFARLAVTVFPFFMLMGLWWTEGHRFRWAVYAAVGASSSGLLMALFANWWWAG
jgi:hypothetical protein